MSEWFFIILNFYSYIYDNLVCLFYYTELFFYSTLFMMSYHDLLVDIAESFSVWVVVTVLLSSYISTLVVIHYISGYNVSTTNSLNLLSRSISYKLLPKFFLFKNRL